MTRTREEILANLQRLNAEQGALLERFAPPKIPVPTSRGTQGAGTAFKVTIDDVEDTLTRTDQGHGSRGFTYLTRGNTSAHGFPFELAPGQSFRVNGHKYRIFERVTRTISNVAVDRPSTSQ